MEQFTNFDGPTATRDWDHVHGDAIVASADAEGSALETILSARGGHRDGRNVVSDSWDDMDAATLQSLTDHLAAGPRSDAETGRILREFVERYVRCSPAFAELALAA